MANSLNSMLLKLLYLISSINIHYFLICFPNLPLSDFVDTYIYQALSFFYFWIFIYTTKIPFKYDTSVITLFPKTPYLSTPSAKIFRASNNIDKFRSYKSCQLFPNAGRWLMTPPQPWFLCVCRRFYMNEKIGRYANDTKLD